MKITCEKMISLNTCQTKEKTQVKYLLEGESIITDDSNTINEKQIINPSSDRIKIKCPIFDRCGGCDFSSYQLSKTTYNERRTRQKPLYKC